MKNIILVLSLLFVSSYIWAGELPEFNVKFNEKLNLQNTDDPLPWKLVEYDCFLALQVEMGAVGWSDYATFRASGVFSKEKVISNLKKQAEQVKIQAQKFYKNFRHAIYCQEKEFEKVEKE